MQTKHLRYPKGLTRGFQVAPSAFHWPKKLQAEKDRALSHCHVVMETGCAAVLSNSRKAVAVGSNQHNNQQKTMSKAGFVFHGSLNSEALSQPPPTRLHGMTFTFLSDRNPFWTHSDPTSRDCIFNKKYVCHVSAPSCYLPPPQVPVCYLFKLPVN